MKTSNSFPETENRLARSKLRNAQAIRIIQMISWAITLLFIISLIAAIYQAIANRNPMPAWAWLGLVVLFAVAIGMGVAIAVYRGVAKKAGPFDFRPSSRVAGEIKSETHQVEAGGARSVRAELRMIQGVLHLAGGAVEVLDADFTYDDADWKPPVVAYAVTDEAQGNLDVEQKPTGRPAMHQGHCDWSIRLNQDLPTELSVKLGAGEADLKLGGMTLDRLWVESGVGKLVLDLSGEWKRGLEAFIKTGISDAVLRIPQNAGVRIQPAVGFGSIQPHGLEWDGEAYTNTLYGQAAVSLNITLEGGMGKLTLEPTG